MDDDEELLDESDDDLLEENEELLDELLDVDDGFDDAEENLETDDAVEEILTE